jgi:hypothetical protein
MRLEGLGKLKNPMATSGLEPVTFRLVAYDLNQLRYRVPLGMKLGVIISSQNFYYNLHQLLRESGMQSLPCVAQFLASAYTIFQMTQHTS